jgi:hypothetical protein
MTDYDDLVKRYVELEDQRASISIEMDSIKAQLVDLGRGTHEVAGVKVTVSNPPRRFDLEAAWAVLSSEQQALAVSPDAKKVKEFLPPIVADSFMREGNGNPVVRIS